MSVKEKDLVEGKIYYIVAWQTYAGSEEAWLNISTIKFIRRLNESFIFRLINIRPDDDYEGSQFNLRADEIDARGDKAIGMLCTEQDLLKAIEEWNLEEGDECDGSVRANS